MCKGAILRLYPLVLPSLMLQAHSVLLSPLSNISNIL